MSAGTRSISDGVLNVGKPLFLDDPNTDPSPVILGITSAVDKGVALPKLILAGPSDASPEQLVLVEGHNGATIGYFALVILLMVSAMLAHALFN